MKLLLLVRRIGAPLFVSSAVVLVFFLSSCAVAPDSYDPIPANYQAQIRARMTRELRHPEGASLSSFEEPGKIWQADIIPHGNPVEGGYQVLFWVRDGGDRSASEWYADFFHGAITDIGPYQDPLFQ